MTVRSTARTRAGLAALALTGLLVAATPAAASSADGTWWYSGMGVAEANAAGATGAGVTVAVIDAGINPDLPMFAGADLHVHEPSFCFDVMTGTPYPAARTDITQAAAHGSNVAGFVVGTGQGFDGATSQRGVAPEARLLFYSVGDLEKPCLATYSPVEGSPDAMALAVRQAVDDGADIITTSITGSMSVDPDVQAAIAWAQTEGTIVISALSQDEAENDTALYSGDDLAKLNGVVAVEACDADLRPITGRDGAQMEHEKITVCAPGVDVLVQGDERAGDWRPVRTGSGTSYAAPTVAGALAAVWSAWPDATANQILQTLVHDTGSEEHELNYTADLGYGLVGLRHMLREDPARFPDENPLVHDVGDGPNVDATQITLRELAEAERPVWPGDPEWTGSTAAATAEPDATSTPAAQAPDAPSDTSGGTPVWVWGVAGLAAAAVVTAAALLARRRSSGTAPVPAQGTDR
ncbi:S8/S53 family peptidase [Cellulomonas sp.]|uniref:S8 family peptidase n=1 Tax=Cellulomonas sp. TaxID=40001 RepID=UPI002810B841|nr:S8/S53 family peptidase [Cellulomonas sp.]